MTTTTARLLDGGPVARDIRSATLDELSRLTALGAPLPSLAIVEVGGNPSSAAYRDSIVRAAQSVDIGHILHHLPDRAPHSRFQRLIEDLNRDRAVQGVIVLQPLPQHLEIGWLAEHLDPGKDIDGITSQNAGRLALGDLDTLLPSTPAGGMAMLEHFQVPLDGKHAVIVGRSPVVGRPMALMLLAANATVTICHSRTADLHAYTQQADILIAAAGRARMITGEMVKPGATVIDFGVNVVDGEVCGDVDDRSVSVVAGALTPVPGGTGNVTTAVLLRNTVKAAWRQLYRETREEIG